jgi:hypothetical protein
VICLGEHTEAVSSSIFGISALFERQPDTLDHEVMDPASFIESNLPQRLIRSLWQANIAKLPELCRNQYLPHRVWLVRSGARPNTITER